MKEKMKRAVGTIICVVAGIVLVVLAMKDVKAADTYTLRIGENSVTLTEEPCTLGGWFKDWKKANWIYAGQRYEACWRMQQSQNGPIVHTVDSAGDVGSLPPQAFKRDEAI